MCCTGRSRLLPLLLIAAHLCTFQPVHTFNSNLELVPDINTSSSPTPTPRPEDVQSLFFTSPGGVSYATRDGVYGVTVDYRKQVSDGLHVTRRLPISFDCFAFGSEEDGLVDFEDEHPMPDRRKNPNDELRVKSMSYDPISGYVLMDILTADDYSLTLVRGQPCSSTVESHDTFAPPSINCNVTVANDTDEISGLHRNLEVLFYNAKIADNARVGPFAYYDSRLFFILQRLERPDYRTKLNMIELRQMSTTCSDGTTLDAPVTATNSDFDVVDCSTVVANVTSEEYDTYYAYRPLGTLLVVRGYGTVALDDGGSVRIVDGRGRLDFYFQMQRVLSINDTSVDVSIVLYHASSSSSAITADDYMPSPSPQSVPSTAISPRWPRVRPLPAAVTEPDGSSRLPASSGETWAKSVHEQPVDAGYLKYVLVQLGGLDHRRNKLCWAAIDRVLCGTRSTETGRVDDVVTAVDVHQAAIVCHAPDNSADLRHVITGLAISYSIDDREVVLYFGCAAQVDLGGVGGQQIGGAGVVRLPAYGVWPARITPVQFSLTEPIHAGAMFVVDHCADYSNWNVDDVGRSGSPETVGLQRLLPTFIGLGVFLVNFRIR